MPTYLCHGFRWQRRSIRVFVVVQDLDDASPEWIIRKATARALLDSFYGLFDFLPSCSPPRPPRSRSASTGSVLSKAQHPHHYHAHSQTRVRSRTRSQQGRRNGSASRSNSLARVQPQHGPRSRAGTDASGRERSVRRGSRSPAPAGRRRPANTNSNATGEFEDDEHMRGRAMGEDDGFEDEPDEIHAEAEEEEDAVLAQQWSPVRLLEEYDPRDLTSVSSPWAYVADHVVRVDVSASIGDEIATYEEKLRKEQTRWREGRGRGKSGTGFVGAEELPAMVGSRSASAPSGGWLERLRDQLQRGEKIGWYIVVNGDEERAWPENPTPPASHSLAASIRAGVSNGDGDDLDGSTPASAPRRQAEHGYYTYQQKLFEGADRDIEREREKERARERLRAEFGGQGVGVGQSERDARRNTRPPPRVPEKDVPVAVGTTPRTPVMGHKTGGSGSASSPGGLSVGGSTPAEQQRHQDQPQQQKAQQRTSKQGGFRRLFGRSKSSLDDTRSAKS